MKIIRCYHVVTYYTAVVRSVVAYGPGTRAAKKAHEKKLRCGGNMDAEMNVWSLKAGHNKIQNN